MTLERREYAAIFLGGAAGALARVGLTQLFPSAPSQWPWAVFAINLGGAFGLGYLVRHIEARGAHRLARPLLGSGFCGAFTTFSTLQLELFNMLSAGRGWLALAYGTASILGGLALVEAGRALVPAAMEVPG